VNGYQFADFEGVELSVALTTTTDRTLVDHFDEDDDLQEDLTFAYWRPSRGERRYTAVLNELALPEEGERILQGNVAFTPDYIGRVLDECPEGAGIALLHSHLGPGWQRMSDDDVVAERDRLAGVVAGRTGLPLVGLTWGTDGTWSARFWLRAGRHEYQRRWASTVRSVGNRLRISFNPELRPEPTANEQQVATRSVWGDVAQSQLARTHVGVVGLGSVGSIVAEALSRTGIQQITLIDHDRIELRNLDRTLGAYARDVDERTPKVTVSKRLLDESHTSDPFEARAVPESLVTERGLRAALDCDALICCVDRPWPRHVLNKLSYLHLIPVVDGGILARVTEIGTLAHVDWTIQTVGPERACLYCLATLLRSDAALDRDGLLDEPDYIQGLSPAERERYERRNVFAFSLSVAAHEILQLVGLITGNTRVGGIGPQRYRAYPGAMEVEPETGCNDNCDIAPLTGTAGVVIEFNSPPSEDPPPVRPHATSLLQRLWRWLR
jgi:molybdopterin/thiamine biosynthesis adenylyltransferase